MRGVEAEAGTGDDWENGSRDVADVLGVGGVVAGEDAELQAWTEVQILFVGCAAIVAW